MGTGEIHFIGGAIEYNARVCDTWDSVQFDSIHFEMDLKAANTNPFRVFVKTGISLITINGGMILTLPNTLGNVQHWIPTPIIYTTPASYVFENNVASGDFPANSYYLKLDNVSLQFNQATSTKEVVGGTGAVFSLVKAYVSGGSLSGQMIISSALNSYWNSVFDFSSDSLLPENKCVNMFINASDTTYTDRFGAGSNITFDIDGSNGEGGGACLKMTKAASTNNASVALFMPVDSTTNGMIIKLRYKFSKVPTSNVFRLVANVGYAVKGTIKAYVYTPELWAYGSALAGSTSYQDAYIIVKKPKPSANSIQIVFDLTGIVDSAAVSVYVDNVIVNLL